MAAKTTWKTWRCSSHERTPSRSTNNVIVKTRVEYTTLKSHQHSFRSSSHSPSSTVVDYLQGLFALLHIKEAKQDTATAVAIYKALDNALGKRGRHKRSLEEAVGEGYVIKTSPPKRQKRHPHLSCLRTENKTVTKPTPQCIEKCSNDGVYTDTVVKITTHIQNLPRTNVISVIPCTGVYDGDGDGDSGTSLLSRAKSWLKDIFPKTDKTLQRVNAFENIKNQLQCNVSSKDRFQRKPSIFDHKDETIVDNAPHVGIDINLQEQVVVVQKKVKIIKTFRKNKVDDSTKYYKFVLKRATHRNATEHDLQCCAVACCKNGGRRPKAK